MLSDNAAGRRVPDETLHTSDDNADTPWTIRQRLLWLGATAWRRAWGLLPDRTTAIRIRVSTRLRRLFGTPPARWLNPRNPKTFHRWAAIHAAPNGAAIAAIRAHIASFPAPPRLVLRLDARGAPAEALQASCSAFLAQHYPYWEARLLGATGLPADPRLIPLATPEDPTWAVPESAWVLPLAPGDILFDTALYRIAAEAQASSSLDIIYGDECRPDGFHAGIHPWFKPEFDLDRLLGGDLFGHAVAFRSALLPPRPEASPGGWYGAGLRAALAAGPARIGHIPALLTTRPIAPPPPAAAAAIADALGITARPLPPATAGWRRLVWPLPAAPPLVSVIVPTRDRAGLVAACAEGVLHRTDYPAIEFLLVDNGSTEPETHALFDRLRADPRVRILPSPGPFNYSALNNQAAAAARGEILLLLNNDIEVIDAGWLREMVSLALRPEIGAVGAKLLYADGTLQHGGVVTGVGGIAGHYHLGAPREDTGYFGSLAMTREVAAATGACLALRREVFHAVGGLDAQHLAVAFNDIDLCLRIRAAGLRILWTPFAELFHLESASRGQDTTPEKARRFAVELAHMRRRWGKVLLRDPFYNRNLDLDSAADMLAGKPRHQPPWLPYLGRP